MPELLLKLNALGFQFTEVPLQLRYDLKPTASKMGVGSNISTLLKLLVHSRLHGLIRRGHQERLWTSRHFGKTRMVSMRTSPAFRDESMGLSIGTAPWARISIGLPANKSAHWPSRAPAFAMLICWMLMQKDC